ncbi:MAG: HRDC domain-containing protein [Bdellovibrionales bacterium]|nr:HRDC domain-containing protein [Bdellovibrionales bacterium]
MQKSLSAPLKTPAEIVDLAKALREHTIISFDTEFIRENTFYPSVELIQVATRNQSWLVDAQAFRGKNVEGLRPLLDVFEDPKILKILHAAQGDQECLYTSYKVVAKPSFDTAVGAALCGYGDGIGLGNLLKALLNVNLKKGHARTNWAARPLPDQLLEYAHADVEFLVEAGEKLLAKLDETGRRQWALDLSAKWEDEKLYQPDPEGLTHKLAKSGRMDAKTYSTLLELMKWREERVRQLNLPRRWVADDQVLLDLANVKPKDLQHLSAFRGLNKGEMKSSGEKILEAIRVGAEAKAGKGPESARIEHPTGDESQTLDLMKTYLGILADRERIAMKHLLTMNQLLPILREKAGGPEEWVAKKLLSAEAARLVGGELHALLQGKRALSIDGRKIKIVAL